MKKVNTCYRREPESLWHFLSFGTFVKTFTNKKIWLSDIVKSNDENELFVAQLIADNMDADFEKILREKGIEEARKNIYNLSKSEIIRDIAAPCQVWAYCFTTDIDNLWMWKEYGDNFSGIAVEFNYEKLKNLVKNFNDENDLVTFDLFPIIYGDDIPENEISNLLSSIKNTLLDDINNQALLNKLARFFSQHKNPFFAIENEYRIIALNEVKQRIKCKIKDEKYEAAGNRVINNFGDNLLSTNEVKANVKFRIHVQQNEIVSHIECPVDLKELITSVRFCKKHSKEEIEKILCLSLGENRIDVKQQPTSYKPR